MVNIHPVVLLLELNLVEDNYKELEIDISNIAIYVYILNKFFFNILYSSTNPKV